MGGGDACHGCHGCCGCNSSVAATRPARLLRSDRPTRREPCVHSPYPSRTSMAAFGCSVPTVHCASHVLVGPPGGAPMVSTHRFTAHVAVPMISASPASSESPPQSATASPTMLPRNGRVTTKQGETSCLLGGGGKEGESEPDQPSGTHHWSVQSPGPAKGSVGID